jgi:hypothetical protein
MPTPTETLIDLETKFWQAIVDQDPETATELLTEPALMVSAHGAMKFDHAGYRKMAEKGTMVLTEYELSDMDVLFPNDTTAVLTYRVKQVVTPRDREDGIVQEMNDSSTWIRRGDQWQCVAHTETPANGAGKRAS